MRTTLTVVVAGGGFLGYRLARAWMACEWLYAGSNLCGLVGVFVTGPIGAVTGGIGG
jgi:hypothetical protein